MRCRSCGRSRQEAYGTSSRSRMATYVAGRRTQAACPSGGSEGACEHASRPEDSAKVPRAWRRDVGRSRCDAKVVGGTPQARPFRRGIRDCAQGPEGRVRSCQESGRETAVGQEGLSGADRRRTKVVLRRTIYLASVREMSEWRSIGRIKVRSGSWRDVRPAMRACCRTWVRTYQARISSALRAA